MYLMHKDKFVAKLTTYQGIIAGVSEVYNKELLPIGMQGSKEFADWKILTWLTNRLTNTHGQARGVAVAIM